MATALQRRTILGGALLVATAAVCERTDPCRRLYPDFDAAQVELTVKLTRIVLFGPLFFLVGGLLNAAEMAYERHRGGADALVYNARIIAGGLFLEPWMGVAGFSVGAMVGVILGPFAVLALRSAPRAPAPERLAPRSGLQALRNSPSR